MNFVTHCQLQCSTRLTTARVYIVRNALTKAAFVLGHRIMIAPATRLQEFLIAAGRSRVWTSARNLKKLRVLLCKKLRTLLTGEVLDDLV